MTRTLGQPMMSTLSEDRFMTEYRPRELQTEGEYMLETFEAARALAGGDVSHVWAVIESGDSEALYAAAGYHLVNCLGYLVTEVAWETGLEEAIWFNEDEAEEVHG
jgi:hypothetical protein